MPEDTSHLSYSSIGEGAFPDHSVDTPQHEISLDEARTVLENWVRVATYNLPRRAVAEVLAYQAEILKQ